MSLTMRQKKTLQCILFAFSGPLISPMLRWCDKLPPILAFDGGIVRLVKQYLQDTGKYQDFYDIVEKHRRDVFGRAPISEVTHGVFMPTRVLDKDDSRFTRCSSRNYTDMQISKCSAHHSTNSAGVFFHLV